MVHIITVLNFVTGNVTVYKNVDLKGMDAEDWLRDNTSFDLDNCQWMAVEYKRFRMDVVDVTVVEETNEYVSQRHDIIKKLNRC